MRATLLGIMPYAGLSFATFETLKVYVRNVRHLAADGQLDTPTRLACGGIAGLVAQSATYPLDIVRRRLQVHARAWIEQTRREFCCHLLCSSAKWCISLC